VRWWGLWSLGSLGSLWSLWRARSLCRCLCGGLARFLHEVVLGLVVEQLLFFTLEVELLLCSLLLLLEGC
jgi:tetrahydromethanopterin S-methyltransferase subunit B